MNSVNEEIQHLRSSSVEQESAIQQSLADQSDRIAELENLVQQYEADREAAEVKHAN